MIIMLRIFMQWKSIKHKFVQGLSWWTGVLSRRSLALKIWLLSNKSVKGGAYGCQYVNELFGMCVNQSAYGGLYSRDICLSIWIVKTAPWRSINGIIGVNRIFNFGQRLSPMAGHLIPLCRLLKWMKVWLLRMEKCLRLGQDVGIDLTVR